MNINARGLSVSIGIWGRFGINWRWLYNEYLGLYVDPFEIAADRPLLSPSDTLKSTAPVEAEHQRWSNESSKSGSKVQPIVEKDEQGKKLSTLVKRKKNYKTEKKSEKKSDKAQKKKNSKSAGDPAQKEQMAKKKEAAAIVEVKETSDLASLLMEHFETFTQKVLDDMRNPANNQRRQLETTLINETVLQGKI